MAAIIWVFNGEKSTLPSGTFSSKDKAVKWIKTHKLSGILTKYPVDISVFDWAVNNGYFKPKNGLQQNARSIANFTSASLEHFHFIQGEEQ